MWRRKVDPKWEGRKFPPPRWPDSWPDWVVCYGCGLPYRVHDPEASGKHNHHTGDAGLPRAALLAWLQAAQAERDHLAQQVSTPGDGRG